MLQFFFRQTTCIHAMLRFIYFFRNSLFFSICSPTDVEYAGFEHNILDTIGMRFIIIKYIVSITYRIKVFAQLLQNIAENLKGTASRVPSYSIEFYCSPQTNKCTLN